MNCPSFLLSSPLPSSRRAQSNSIWRPLVVLCVILVAPHTTRSFARFCLASNWPKLTQQCCCEGATFIPTSTALTNAPHWPTIWIIKSTHATGRDSPSPLPLASGPNLHHCGALPLCRPLACCNGQLRESSCCWGHGNCLAGSTWTRKASLSIGNETSSSLI